MYLPPYRVTDEAPLFAWLILFLPQSVANPFLRHSPLPNLSPALPSLLLPLPSLPPSPSPLLTCPSWHLLPNEGGRKHGRVPPYFPIFFIVYSVTATFPGRLPSSVILCFVCF